MTVHDLSERDLVSWLDAEAAVTAPAGLHAGAIERARRARQRPAWLVAVRGGTFRTTPPGGRMDRRAVALLAVLGLLVAAALAALAAGAFRSDGLRLGRNGAIAYSFMTGPGTTSEQAHLVNADGSADRSLGLGACPTFSAGGGAMAFVTDTHDGELVVADADGSSQQPIPDTDPWAHALSPDGEEVVWVRGDSGMGTEVWVTPVAGRPGRRLVARPNDPRESYALPTWSPDGRRIAFAVLAQLADGNDQGAYRTAINVVEADGSDQQRLTARPGADTLAISWSPDGRHLAYLGLPDGSPLPTSAPRAAPPWGLFVIGADGTGDHRVGADLSYPEQVRWSPDGRRLAFMTLVDDTWHLATLPMSGPDAAGRPRVGPALPGTYTWSPDGSRLAYVHTIRRYDHSQPGRSAILTVDPEFHEPPGTVAELDRTITCVSWQWLAP